MKNRILSLALAVLMIVSTVTLFTVSSNADEIDTSKAIVLDDVPTVVTLGTSYVAVGSTETAAIDVYLYADSLPDTCDHLRNWQFAFDLPAGMTLAGYANLYTSDEDPKAFYNESTFTVGCTSNTSTASTAKNCGTAEQIQYRGGWRLATILVDIGSAPVGEYEISVARIDTISFEDGALQLYKVESQTTCYAGKIEVISAKGYADEVYGAGEDFIIPTTNAAGERVIDLMNESDDYVIGGEFGLLTIPAAIVNNVADAIDNLDGLGAAVVKGTDFGDDNKSVWEKIAQFGDSEKINVYYHKRADGNNPFLDSFNSLSAKNKKKLNPVNLLTVFDTTVKVDGNKVSFVTGITAPDVDYTKLTLAIEFVGVRKFFVDAQSVYTTVTDIATVDEATAISTGLTKLDAAYLSALTVNGVPTGNYQVKITLYGTTPDAGGTDVVVCSDSVTLDIVV